MAKRRGCGLFYVIYDLSISYHYIRTDPNEVPFGTTLGVISVKSDLFLAAVKRFLAVCADTTTGGSSPP
ncbi:MAG: hypothetical protein LBC19_13115 [Tannerella sp.]|nr:hypothetical protein [Tannerella sp.]